MMLLLINMKTKKSFEEVEGLKLDLKGHIERCVELYDQLLSYQTNIIEPILKAPFCFRCGESLEEHLVDKLWKCENCRKEEKSIREAKRRVQVQINLQGD